MRTQHEEVRSSVGHEIESRLALERNEIRNLKSALYEQQLTVHHLTVHLKQMQQQQAVVFSTPASSSSSKHKDKHQQMHHPPTTSQRFLRGGDRHHILDHSLASEYRNTSILILMHNPY